MLQYNGTLKSAREWKKILESHGNLSEKVGTMFFVGKPKPVSLFIFYSTLGRELKAVFEPLFALNMLIFCHRGKMLRKSPFLNPR